MGFLSGITDAIGGALGGVGKAIGGITESLGGIGDLLKGVMDSPLGGLISAVFPPAGAIMGALNMAQMVGDMANQIGGGESY